MIIINGDCLEVMQSMEENSIDSIVTDPPYGINKGKIDGNETTDIFFKSIPLMYRILKDASWCSTYCSIQEIGNVINTFQQTGFKFQWQYINYINNGMVRGRMGFSCYMSVLIFSKGNAKIKKQLRDVCELSASSKELKLRVHPYQKDIRFITPLIKSTTPQGGTVLDPFSGSGSTLIAARNEGFNYIGIELNKEYCEIAEKRLKDVR